MSFLGNLFNPPQVNTNIQAPNVNFAPPNFSGGGLSATFGSNGYSVSPSAARSSAVGNVASTFGQQAQDIGNLRQQWAPGSSALRTSLMSALQNNRTQALGNLRDNLAQRRVLGSSFAQNSLATADQEYQQKIQEVQAQTFMQELQAQQQLIQQQYTAARGQFQTGLDEMNLEAGMAADLTGRATSAMASAATTQAQLDLNAKTASLNAQEFNAGQNANYASGFGKFLGSAFGGPLSSAVSGIGSSISSSLAGSSLASSGVGDVMASLGPDLAFLAL